MFRLVSNAATEQRALKQVLASNKLISINIHSYVIRVESVSFPEVFIKEAGAKNILPVSLLGKKFWKKDLCGMLKIYKFWFRYLLRYKRDITKNKVKKSANYGEKAQGQINIFFESLA